MTLNFSISEDDNKKYVSAYADYVKLCSTNGLRAVSQSAFFIEILNYFLFDNNK